MTTSGDSSLRLRFARAPLGMTTCSRWCWFSARH